MHNFRKKLNLDKSYLGNTIIVFNARLSVMDLLEQDIFDVAILIWKEINGLSPDLITSKVTYFEQADDWNLITPNLHLYDKDSCVSSWETFPLFDIEFNSKPEELLYDDMRTGILWNFPANSKNELSLYICLERNEIEIFLEDECVKQYFKIC